MSDIINFILSSPDSTGKLTLNKGIVGTTFHWNLASFLFWLEKRVLPSIESSIPTPGCEIAGMKSRGSNWVTDEWILSREDIEVVLEIEGIGEIRENMESVELMEWLEVKGIGSFDFLSRSKRLPLRPESTSELSNSSIWWGEEAWRQKAKPVTLSSQICFTCRLNSTYN